MVISVDPDLSFPIHHVLCTINLVPSLVPTYYSLQIHFFTLLVKLILQNVMYNTSPIR